jgi:F0F1-type ATP synthase assembly protein I
MAAALALSTLGGAWLDTKLDTKPWLTLGGALLGLVGGLLELLRTVRRL